jgi:hypothetical protein
MVAAAGTDVVGEADVAALVVGEVLEGVESLAVDDGRDAVDCEGGDGVAADGYGDLTTMSARLRAKEKTARKWSAHLLRDRIEAVLDIGCNIA